MGFTPSGLLETSTLEKWFRAKIEPIFTRSVFMSALKEHGCILYGAKNTGKVIKWVPTVRRQEIYTLDAYNVQHKFPVVQDDMTVELPMVAYGLGRKLTKFDRLANEDSETQLANLVQEATDKMAENFMHDFPTKLYLDGGATGSKDLHGMESMYSVNGCIASSFMGKPNDTYAGKSTAHGALGGDWSGTFPDGHGDTERIAWSPQVFDITNALWATNDTKSWAKLWQEILNAAMAYQGRLQSRKYDAFLTNTSMLREMEDSMIGLEQVLLESSSKMVDAGHDVRKFKGMDVMHEYKCPENVGYFVQWKELALLSMQKQLVAYEKDYKIESSEQIYAADFYGNMRFWSPAFFGKVLEITEGS